MHATTPTRHTSPIRRLLFFALLSFLLLLFTLGLTLAPARAATLTVTNTNDSGPGSLRAAIATANTDGGDDTINFSLPSGTYPQITLSSTLTITAPMTLSGLDVLNLTIDGGNSVQVFSISGGTTLQPVVLVGLTIADGNAPPIENDTAGGEGGGIYNGPGDVLTLTGCTLEENTVSLDAYGDPGAGGGLYNSYGSTATLTGCTLAANSVNGGQYGGSGGGLFNNGTATLTGCTLTNNSVNGGQYGGSGGGLFNNGTATLTGCTLTNNSANNYYANVLYGIGGGLCEVSGHLTLTDCTLTNNSASSGGAIDHFAGYGGTFTLTNCVLTRNHASYGGAVVTGASGGTDGTDTLTNCTLTANSATQDAGGIHVDGSLTLDNDILYGDTAPGHNEVGSGTVSATYCDIGQSDAPAGSDGNIDADPQFGNAPYDVTLAAGSPCIGAGDPAQAGTKDINGAVRFNPPTIGANEGYSLVVTNANASGTGSLSGVLLAARSAPDAVITFDPFIFQDFNTITPAATLELTQSVEIVGPAGGVAVSGGNRQGIFQVDSGVQAILTGLTMTDGKASGGFGGGLDNIGGTATLTGCTLTGNTAQFTGGGLYNDTGGTATLTGCTLTGNTSSGDGGGIGNGGTGNNTLALTDCTLTGNSATIQGGGIVILAGKATLTDCTLTGNTAPNQGGGILNFGGTLALTDCTLTGNSAYFDGAGGGLANLAGTATLDNDILFGDTAPSNNEISGSVSATYCDIDQNGYTDTGDIRANPLFVGSPGNLQLQPNSACIGKGDPTQAGTYDIIGTLRPNPPSIGAYEGTPAATRTHIQSSSNSSLYGQSVTFTATVANNSPGSSTFPTGSVEFYVNGIPAATVSLTNVGGVATATYTTTSLEGGTDYVTASLMGNAQFTSSSSDPLRHDVGAASTSTGVIFPDNPTTAGEQFFYGAQVTDTSPGSSAAPTGSVAFYVDGSTTPLYTEPLGYDGYPGYAYSPTKPITKAGTYTITAKYLGDSDFTGSMGSMQLTVNPGPAAALTLTAPPNATAGQPFQATVSVTDAYGNPVTSSARVTFTSTDARAALPAPVSLTNGTATVTVTDYTAGSQTLTASASGLTIATATTTVASDPQGAPSISVNSVTLTRGTGANSSVVTVSFTLVNTGVGAASAVKVTVAKLGTVSANSVPVATTIGAGQSQAYSLSFTNVPSGTSTLMLNGSYTGTPNGTTTGYAFSGGKKVTVP